MPLRFLGGTTLAPERGNWNMTGAERNAFVGGIPPQGGTPNGYSWPYAWANAVKNGALSSYERATGTSSLTATATRVRASSATLVGSSFITANLAVLSQLLANISASGSITSAQIALVSRLTAALAGSGAITAQMSSTIPVLAALVAQGSINANLTGRGKLECDISPFETLSPQGLANALLDNNEVEEGFSVRQALKLISAALAGEISGAEGTTITIRSLDDSKNRIVATVDSNGNRTSLTYDLSE